MRRLFMKTALAAVAVALGMLVQATSAQAQYIQVFSPPVVMAPPAVSYYPPVTSYYAPRSPLTTRRRPPIMPQLPLFMRPR